MSTKDDQRSDLLVSVTGYAPLRWSAEKPKAAGWWWVEKHDKRRQLVWVEKRSHAFDYSCLYFGNWFWCEDSLFLRWAGPLPEPLEPSDGETGHIDGLHRLAEGSRESQGGHSSQ